MSNLTISFPIGYENHSFEEKAPVVVGSNNIKACLVSGFAFLSIADCLVYVTVYNEPSCEPQFAMKETGMEPGESDWKDNPYEATVEFTGTGMAGLDCWVRNRYHKNRKDYSIVNAEIQDNL